MTTKPVVEENSEESDSSSDEDFVFHEEELPPATNYNPPKEVTLAMMTPSLICTENTSHRKRTNIEFAIYVRIEKEKAPTTDGNAS